MKLRVTGLLLASLMILSVIVPVFAAAAEEPAVEDEVQTETVNTIAPFNLDGAPLTELEYQLIGGVNYVTVESFFTAMSAEAMVEEGNGSVVASCAAVNQVIDMTGAGDGDEPQDRVVAANVVEETLTFTARVNDCYVAANGHYLYVSGRVQTIGGKTAVPIRTMAEIFNLDVAYHGATRSVWLTHRAGTDAYIDEAVYDEDTLYWLSHIIYAESGNQPMLGKIAVGNVVMNRVASPKFPNTIKAVLFQKNQFSPAGSGSIYREPNRDSVIAAKLVMEGAVVLENALFFNMAGMNTYASRNRVYVATIGAHAFFD